MASFEEYKDGYERAWASLTIRPDRIGDSKKEARRLLDGKATYQEVERRTNVPWWFVGLCHYRESDFRFDTYLGNGQSLRRATTEVPRRRGPFTGPNAFVDGAVDALRLEHFVGASDWGIARVLFRLEGFNGFGYHGKGVNSPYLYGGSTAYGPPEARAGKYVADHEFDPHKVDPQLGTAVILKALMGLDSSISFVGGASGPSERPEEPDDELARSTLWLQQSLNRLGVQPPLSEDGKNGKNTMAAVSQFQRENGLTDTGLADAATIAALQRKLQPGSTPGLDSFTQRLGQLENIIRIWTSQTQGGQTPASGQTDMSTSTPDLSALLGQLMTLVSKGQSQGTATAASAAQQADQLRKALEVLVTALAPGADGKAQPLGQVNGALGQTIGNLLDGKKSAIGIIGAMVTEILSHVTAGTGLGGVLAMLTPASGLSPFAMPVFLALSAWGVLGKFEKWMQGTAPPSQPAT